LPDQCSFNPAEFKEYPCQEVSGSRELLHLRWGAVLAAFAADLFFATAR
jgi:hypothetical protein